MSVAPQSDVSRERARTTSVAWLAHARLTHDEWQHYGSRIGLMSKSTNWWLGDWVRFGQRRYDMRYKDASEVTGYDEQTLMNLAYVAGRFEMSRRREALSWSHHAEIAKLDTFQQQRWLDRAQDEQFSVRKLRAELRRFERASLADSHAHDESVPELAQLVHVPDQILCPHCGKPFTASEIAELTQALQVTRDRA